MDTIFALATAQGRAGVAILRVSGDQAWTAVEALVGNLPTARTTAVRVVRDSNGQALDEALVVVFESGASFTGERVAELHLHGSTAVIAAVQRCLSEQPDLRLAEPGEFTRRALENGRLDLSQVEGLADLIDAETEVQRQQALKVMRGALSDKASKWRTMLLRAVTLLEVTIDFADEDVPENVAPEVLDLIAKTYTEMQAEEVGGKISERVRDGFEVAIIGKPNIGKSTLLNRLSGRDAAITSEIAGTTRDVIEVRMDLSGLPVTLLDTAGIRDSDDSVEVLGVERARQRAEAADLRIFLLGSEDDAEAFGITVQTSDIIAHGKSDILHGVGLSVSGKTGDGIDKLLMEIGTELGNRAIGATSAVRIRHRIALQNGTTALNTAMQHVQNGPEWFDLAAEEMRQGLKSLDILIGRIDVENILDEIFSSFCLGK